MNNYIKLAGDYVRGNKVNFLNKVIQLYLKEYGINKPLKLMSLLEKEGFSFFYGDKGTYINPYTFRKVYYDVKKNLHKADNIQDLAVIGLYKMSNNEPEGLETIIYEIDGSLYGVSFDSNFNRRGESYNSDKIININNLIKKYDFEDRSFLEEYLKVFFNGGFNYSFEDIKKVFDEFKIDYDVNLLETVYNNLKPEEELDYELVVKVLREINPRIDNDKLNSLKKFNKEMWINMIIFQLLSKNIPVDKSKIENYFSESNQIPIMKFLNKS